MFSIDDLVFAQYKADCLFIKEFGISKLNQYLIRGITLKVIQVLVISYRTATRANSGDKSLGRVCYQS